jgi:predicted  nucleic acid-binding Zn ribbon protein
MFYGRFFMHIAEVQIAATIVDKYDDDLIYILLVAWQRNGQIMNREFPIALVDKTYRMFLMLPNIEALEPQHNNDYVNAAIEKLAAAGFQTPVVKLLGGDPFSAQPCICPQHSYLILYANALSLESCLRCGDCFQPVPLYKIPWQASTPTKGELHDRIIFWQGYYKSCDRLQLGCTVGERFGLREMSRHDSALSQMGLEVCQDIAAVLGMPVYYYLHRYRGRSKVQECQRLCPSCGGEWLLAERMHYFDFKCDRCRLLSNIAMSLP